MPTPLYLPLYPSAGGPPCGYQCSECGRVTRTQLGMIRHLYFVHQVKTIQGTLFAEAAK